MSLLARKKKVYIIEPHIDDAFLSLGGHIERWVAERKWVTIISVFTSKNRTQEAQEYAAVVGAHSVVLGFPEKSPLTVTNLLSDLVFSSEDRVIGPLAVAHPEHKAVREALPMVTEFYLDMPYAIMLKNSPHVTELLEPMQVTSFLKCHKSRWRHVPIFKSQSKFFFFNTGAKLRECFELIVKPV